MTNARYVMGTILNVRIKEKNAEHVEAIFFEEIQRLEELLSFYQPHSEISRVNRAAGKSPVGVSADTFDVVEKAIDYAKQTNGAFDPTLQLFGYSDVILDSAKRTIFLQKPGMRLDLGGIGKGYALDLALARVQREGSPESVYANFGGQLLFWHWSGSLGPETIVIENPEHQGEVLSKFQIDSNCSISTSSNAEQRQHLRDPRTGKPVQSNRSVTVVAPTATEAEAWSTALFVQGNSPHICYRLSHETFQSGTFSAAS